MRIWVWRSILKSRFLGFEKCCYYFIRLILIWSLTGTNSWGAEDISGYWENRFFLINNSSISWKSIEDKFNLGDYNRLRINFTAAPAKAVTIHLSLDFFSFYGALQSPFGTLNTAADNQTDSNSTQIDLDRIYATIHFKKFDLTVGKQRLAMGVSYIWVPLDVFNRINILEPKEEKPGSNALKLYLPWGSQSGFTLIFSPDEKFGSSKTGFRAKTHCFTMDIGATFIRDGSQNLSVYGLDVRGENCIGWWLEGGFFVSESVTDKKLVIGFDYTFPMGNGLYWLNEFFYDSGGEINSTLYDYDLLIAGKRFLLGQHYAMSRLSYAVNEFFSAALSYIANWSDGSFILNPALSHDLFQNVNLSYGFYFPLGEKGGELNRHKQTIIFIWLKVNF
jgi:hypothetical protein